MLTIVAKTLYLYLVALSALAVWRSCTFGIALDKTGRCLHPILHALQLLVLLLALVQTYQCTGLILSQLNPQTWWIPLICKQSSIIFYHIAISFMRWRLRIVLDEPAEVEV